MDYNTILENNLTLADNGRIFWNNLTKDFSLKAHDVVIVLFQRDKECAEIIFSYGKYLKSINQYENIYILTDDSELLEKSNKMVWVKKSKKSTKKDLERLVLLYQLYKFSRQVIWGTLHDIEDADGAYLKGIKGLSIEDITVTAVLGLSFDKCREQA